MTSRGSRARRAARARGLRARRARRGARPVRGPRRHRRRLPDHRPRAAAHRALRRRDRGDPRLLAVHAARAARRRRGGRLPGRGAAARPRRADCSTTRTARPRRRTTWCRRSRSSRPRLAAGDGASKRGARTATSSSSRERPGSIRCRRGSRPPSRRSARRSPPAGSPRPRTSCRASCAAGSGSSSPSRTAARRCARRTCSAGSTPACSSRRPPSRDPEVLFAVSPARRGFVWRELGLALLPDTQVFRKRAPRGDARIGRALQSFADLRTGDYVVHEDHGVGKLLGFETKTVAGVTRDYLFVAFRGEDRLYVPHEQIGKVSRYVGADARAPALSKLGGKAWQLIKSRARESVRELAGELIALYARRQTTPRRRVRPDERLARAARGELPVPRDGRPADGDRGRQGGSRGAAADGPARLRRRRLRQDRGGAAGRVRGRARRQAGADARADDRPRAAALEHVPRALPRLPRARRDDLALPQAGRREAGAGRVRRGQGRGPDRHAPRAVARRDPEGARARDRRRGAALRRRAEGAAARRCDSRSTCSR